MTRWSPANAIREARQAAGLDKETLAALLGPGLAWYERLESRDDAVFSDLSLAHLSILAGLLDTTPRALLAGPASPESGALSFRSLAAALQARAEATGTSLDELGARAGWDLRDAVVDPEECWNLTVAQLQKLAQEVGMDWTALLSGGLPVFMKRMM